MIIRIIKIVVIGLALVAIPVIYFGIQFYSSGENYGQMLQTAHDDTERLTQYGKVVGFVDNNGSHTWMGIPYASPPVKELRWKTPEKPAHWQGRLNALQARDFCTQIGSQMESRPPKEWRVTIGSEDCLYMNIFAPRLEPDQLPRGNDRLPVMVYIHGGGNMVGYANQYKYSGTNMARNQNLIVVTFNYRLGPFGWFSHPALNSNGSAQDRSGNYGNLDTIRALQWVQNNIEAFGGNPANVTLFGESAGGMNTFALLASPLAGGLFHRPLYRAALPHFPRRWRARRTTATTKLPATAIVRARSSINY
jgi:para-nitrobenzyl esterase